MMTLRYPTEPEIRAALLARADEFCRLTGKARNGIGLAAVNDGALLTQVEAGRTPRPETYRKVMDWLDANWPAEAGASS